MPWEECFLSLFTSPFCAMMLLAWLSIYLTGSEWKGHRSTRRENQRSQQSQMGRGLGTSSTLWQAVLWVRGTRTPLAETRSKVLPYVSSTTVPTSYRVWSVAISWLEHSSLKWREAAFTTYMLMNRNDIEHLKQNVPIFILHGQIFALIFMRDSSFISPRDFFPAQREGIKDK